jgi:hypothetical protein
VADESGGQVPPAEAADREPAAAATVTPRIEWWWQLVLGGSLALTAFCLLKLTDDQQPVWVFVPAAILASCLIGLVSRQLRRRVAALAIASSMAITSVVLVVTAVPWLLLLASLLASLRSPVMGSDSPGFVEVFVP